MKEIGENARGAADMAGVLASRPGCPCRTRMDDLGAPGPRARCRVAVTEGGRRHLAEGPLDGLVSCVGAGAGSVTSMRERFAGQSLFTLGWPG